MRYKSFSLGGHDIKVKYQKVVRNPADGAEIFGLCNPLQNVMLVATHLANAPLSEDVILHSFCHELGHFMLILMGEQELNQNEDFVDLLGAFLHQFLKTNKCLK